MTAAPATLFVCQPGYEDLLAREAGAGPGAEQGSGWVLAGAGGPSSAPAAGDLAFAHLVFEAPVAVEAEGVNRLAAGLLDVLCEWIRGERIEGPWPCVFLGSAAVPGLGRRVTAVEDAFREALKARLGRLARTAVDRVPPGVGPSRGFFVWFAGHGRALASRSILRGGQRRMSDDPLAPSRSYLKVEEAYGIIGAEPVAGETVCDLGAAPGGWSYSAARRGARVVAIDNGPMKGGALGHPRIEHRREDAFAFRPEEGVRFDWLFCDLLEEPHHVLRSIVAPWLERGWCRRFVVNLKFGRTDAIGLLGELRAGGFPAAIVSGIRIRHLFHDRDEFTLTGEAAA